MVHGQRDNESGEESEGSVDGHKTCMTQDSKAGVSGENGPVTERLQSQNGSRKSNSNTLKLFDFFTEHFPGEVSSADLTFLAPSTLVCQLLLLALFKET